MNEALLISLPSDWYTEVSNKDIDPALPGIYLWEIEDKDNHVDKYIGKYTKISRPKLHYGSIVRRLLQGRPYRKGKPDNFRLIHKALAEAVRKKKTIRLTILENCESASLNKREQELIKEMGCTLNKPIPPKCGPAASASA